MIDETRERVRWLCGVVVGRRRKKERLGGLHTNGRIVFRTQEIQGDA